MDNHYQCAVHIFIFTAGYFLFDAKVFTICLLISFYMTYYVVDYSVLVHSGGVHGGHYSAFIRPNLSHQW